MFLCNEAYENVVFPGAGTQISVEPAQPPGLPSGTEKRRCCREKCIKIKLLLQISCSSAARARVLTSLLEGIHATLEKYFAALKQLFGYNVVSVYLRVD